MKLTALDAMIFPRPRSTPDVEGSTLNVAKGGSSERIPITAKEHPKIDITNGKFDITNDKLSAYRRLP